MYLSIPNIFLVPVYYAEKHILEIKIQEYKFYNNSIDKTIERKDLVIGVSLPDRISPRWIIDSKFIEEYAKSNGVTLKMEIDDADIVKQAEQVDKLISQGIDVLILVPVDFLVGADLVEKAHKAGIKVIAYDVLIPNSDIDAYISFNGTKVGELQGQYLTKKIPKGNYIILSGDPGNFNSKIYKDGAMKYIKPLADIGNIKIVADKAVQHWDPKIAYNIVKDILNTNNKIDAILAPNDSIASGVVEALKEEGLAGKVAVTGQNAYLDAIQRIIGGTQSMTVFKDVREEAKTAIDLAIKLANNEPIYTTNYINNGKIDVPSVILEPIAVDKNNIRDIIVDSGYLKLNEVYSKEYYLK
ncbi:xylose-binding protein [Clostridium cavendishii DSM 21758]|uniref:Xylose-binding protein n=1 Tax=Clostridium cavendishii DSM 21758 TaxID=1121302 RepID=A0A1M6IP37_9CLOT|nr:substrate-binding domain-containing protein [Clostridium cavendishii]SHJ36211.1 xylose-binding protein [Clostridium cavendishii DSM 21758]